MTTKSQTEDRTGKPAQTTYTLTGQITRRGDLFEETVTTHPDGTVKIVGVRPINLIMGEDAEGNQIWSRKGDEIAAQAFARWREATEPLSAPLTKEQIRQLVARLSAVLEMPYPDDLPICRLNFTSTVDVLPLTAGSWSGAA